jgi:hypothetical protein
MAGAAERAASTLGKAPSRSSFGPQASYGGSVESKEGKNFSAEQSTSAEKSDRVAKEFAGVQSAIDGLIAKTSNAGERAAMQDFKGQLAKSTDAMHGTKTQATLTQSASDTNSLTNTSGSSIAVNNNPLMAKEALRLSGGSAFKALELMSTPEGRQQVADNVGQQTAAAAGVTSGNATSITGAPIAPPKSVAKQDGEGKAQVLADAGGNLQQATAAGNAAKNKAVAQRGDMGAPSSATAPVDQSPATNRFNSITGEASAGAAAVKLSSQTTGGINRAGDQMFGDKGGAGRLVDSSWTFGLLGQAKTNGELKTSLRDLAAVDSGASARLSDMGLRGTATKEDMQYLSDRADVLSNAKQVANRDEAAQAPW